MVSALNRGLHNSIESWVSLVVSVLHLRLYLRTVRYIVFKYRKIYCKF